MPTLNWLGKDAVLKHHVSYRTLELKESFNCEQGGSENKIIHGDNLEALKALLPEYEGRVKCIYIDPPYNTGMTPESGGWVYNDNVDSPKIRKWLGQVVGKEFEDLTRHDKWLCMMYPRLKLLKKLLSKDGLIFISIDDNEQANLKPLCDEIFGAGNFEGCIHWRRRHNQPNDKTKLIGLVAEYIFVYANDSKLLKENGVGKIPLTGKFSNPDNDPRGNWASKPWKAGVGQGGCSYLINSPDGQVFDEVWLGDENTFQHLLDDGRIYFPRGKKGKLGTPRKKYYQSEREEEGQCATNWWPNEMAGCNQDASDELKEIFPEITNDKVFSTPKPSKLIELIINLGNDKNGIFLDSFAGSGTTAHAVLNLNKQDGGNRKFILVEMEDYANSITAERVRRVINGYQTDVKEELYSKELTVTNLKNGREIIDELNCIRDEYKDEYSELKTVLDNNCLKLFGIKKGSCEGTGGDFCYYELGPEMLLDGVLNEMQPIEKIREYIYYSETNKLIDNDNLRQNGHEFFMGDFDNTAYYLFYKKNEITTLDFEFLATIRKSSERYVIYADNCVLSKNFLFEHNITFKKIPRDVRRF